MFDSVLLFQERPNDLLITYYLHCDIKANIHINESPKTIDYDFHFYNVARLKNTNKLHFKKKAYNKIGLFYNKYMQIKKLRNI